MAISSPQSNGMAERFVKTMKEDYIAFMPKPNVRTALHNLAVAIEHYNENHPHCTLGYRSPREYRRQRVMLTLQPLSGNKGARTVAEENAVKTCGDGEGVRIYPESPETGSARRKSPR